LSFGGSTGTTVSIDTMGANEFTLVAHGVSGLGYMFSLGRANPDLEVSLLNIALNGSGGEALHLTMLRPYPSTAGKAHSTTGLTMNYSSTDNPAWCQARYRYTYGFEGKKYIGNTTNQGTTTNSFVMTPMTNPMTKPGGICVAAAFKDYTAYPDTIDGDGWEIGSYAGLVIFGIHHLSQTKIVTPGNVTFSASGGTNRYWTGVVVYLG
jgi:hypothetical protein